jgi:CheY-like chemotaxis protein
MCKFCIPDRLQPVKIDAWQISQVINNLVINAEQAMPDGGVIKVSADTVTVGQEDGLPLEEGTYIRISVKDEGIGIPEQFLQKIFDPYFTTKQKGSGLGLATSYSIIKNHGGHIAVESELGVGTSFCIWLPASEKEVVTERNLNNLVRGNGKILLMDDDGDILKAIVEALKHLGYETEFAKDGKEAIELYRGAQKMGTPFTAVIVDLTIRGGMGGKETIGELVKINPDVKAIVASGYSTDPVMVNYKEYGFCDVVTKPYSIEELSTTLHEVIYR